MEMNMFEHKIGLANSLLRDGELKRFDLGGTAVLLIRRDANYYAVGAVCPHYGAPLEKGLLKDYTLMCPWHHACFDIRQGMLLEPPALNDLPHFLVRIEQGQVIVTLPQDNNPAPQGAADASDKRHFIILGGGSAGNAAAEELRRSGYVGKITLISQVSNVPIDRPNLSKGYLAGKADPSSIPLRGDKQWYVERGIELRLGTRVTRMDMKAHILEFDGGNSLHYDKLLLATGSTPRQLSDTPGTDLKGIYTLRTLADADEIIKAAQTGKRAVIIGSSFIGMEAAASLAGGREIMVTVVGPSRVPFERTLGEDIGRMFQREHEANGVQFRLGMQVKRFVGNGGHVTGVELTNGEALPADFVVVGVGVRPATGFLREAGLALNEKDQAVRVNAKLQSSDPDVYAADDIARWDDGSESGQRIEHWRVAEQQGIVAARNMLDQDVTMNQHIPFFWTEQWKIGLSYVGQASKWDEIIYRYGKPEEKDFIAFYLSGSKLLAAAGMKHDLDMDAIEFIMQDNKSLTKEQMRDMSFDLVAYAQSA